MKYSLTQKQIIFCQEYLLDFNSTRAAIAAGYSKKSAKEIGHQTLTKLHVKEFLRTQIEARRDRLEISADKVLLELSRTAFYNILDLFHSDGRLKELHEIDKDTAAAIHSIKMGALVVDVDGTKQTRTFIKSFKMQPKDKALDALGKHVGLYEKDNSQKGQTDQATREQFMRELFAAISAANGRGLPEPRKKGITGIIRGFHPPIK